MKQTELKKGFTTGTCAAAAAKAATIMLLTGRSITEVEIGTPKGIHTRMQLTSTNLSHEFVTCSIQKDSGDDPDVTHQTWIYAQVSRITSLSILDEIPYYIEEDCPGVYLTGGVGIGMVTKPGLACPVGKHAINPVPRKMICQAVFDILCKEREYGAFLVSISIPDGVHLAEKTFNPKLGIKGGISVLGTSGIVEPMSEAALIETIRLEIHMKSLNGTKSMILAPGNYGETFLMEKFKLSLRYGVKCSNFIGDSFEIAKKEGIGEILFAGHIGKLIKVFGGVKNTHSKFGDCRMEFLWQAILPFSKDERLKQKILEANTTEEAIEILMEYQLHIQVMDYIVKGIQSYCMEWCDGEIMVEVVTFSSVYGILGMTDGVTALAHRLLENEKKSEGEIWQESCMRSE